MKENIICMKDAIGSMTKDDNFKEVFIFLCIIWCFTLFLVLIAGYNVFGFSWFIFLAFILFLLCKCKNIMKSKLRGITTY